MRSFIVFSLPVGSSINSKHSCELCRINWSDKVALLYFTKYMLVRNVRHIVYALPVHGKVSSQRNYGDSFAPWNLVDLTEWLTPPWLRSKHQLFHLFRVAILSLPFHYWSEEFLLYCCMNKRRPLTLVFFASTEVNTEPPAKAVDKDLIYATVIGVLVVIIALCAAYMIIKRKRRKLALLFVKESS